MRVKTDRTKKNGIKILCVSSPATTKRIKTDNLKLEQYFKYLHQ